MIAMEDITRRLVGIKPQKRQSPEKSGLCRIKMAEAMGFELMDLLQSTVFKSED